MILEGLAVVLTEKHLRIEKCEDPGAAEMISALAGVTFTESFGDMYKPEDLDIFFRDKHSVEIYRRLLGDPAFGIWVAFDENDEAAAYLVAGPCDLPVPDKAENAGELIRFYARKSRHGSGVGGRLMTIGIKWLDAHFDRIYVSVYAENHGAHRLYRRHGFEKIHEYSYKVGNQADPEFIFERR